MDMTIIGRQIALLRREKGSRQEDLANYVGVSAQAVSKWENGGVPDTELLPGIADYFGVSVDTLFGRCITDYSDLQAAIVKKINEVPEEERFAQVMERCWDMERALFGVSSDDLETEKTLENKKKELGEQLRYSSIITDYGFSRMGLSARMQYFLVVPQIPDTQAALFEGIDYPAFFKDFAERDVFDACVMLHRREEGKAFTAGLLMKKLGLEPERAQQVLDILAKYRLIRETAIELDDSTQIVYHFNPTPSFAALLIFAREMIAPPKTFDYFQINKDKAYL
ncbi:MAG: helix-turn-helix transcriptional regulator [Ruminococcaceae bacterium]|nr:helix-turn-helix transcriptional regulator [Oscillospiraceae bacterium]